MLQRKVRKVSSGFKPLQMTLRSVTLCDLITRQTGGIRVEGKQSSPSSLQSTQELKYFGQLIGFQLGSALKQAICDRNYL